MRQLLSILLLVSLVTNGHATRTLQQASYYIFGYGSLLNAASTGKTNCGLLGFSEGALRRLPCKLGGLPPQ